VRKLKGIDFMVIVHYFMLFSLIGSLAYMMLVQRVRFSSCLLFELCV